MTTGATLKAVVYILAVLLAAVVLFWASEMLFVVGFGWPTNSLLRNWLNLVGYCILPVGVAGLLITNALRAAGKGNLWLGLALVLAPVLAVGAFFSAVYWWLS
jgi:hypothetical protein